MIQLTMMSNGAHLRGNQSGNVSAGHLDFTTHPSTVCVSYQILLVAYYKARSANTFLYIPSDLCVILLSLFHILCHFFFINIFAGPKF